MNEVATPSGMHRTSPAIDKLMIAMAAAQADLENPEKTKTAKIKAGFEYSYADIADVLSSARPVLARHKIAIMQLTRMESGAVILCTRLALADQWIEADYPVCSINGNHQSMGAAMTYARRYSLTAILGIAADSDMDGSIAAPSGEGAIEKMSVHQAKKEVNWEAVQAEIDSAETMKRLEAIKQRVNERKRFWPSSYYTSAMERIDAREAELIAEFDAVLAVGDE